MRVTLFIFPVLLLLLAVFYAAFVYSGIKGVSCTGFFFVFVAFVHHQLVRRFHRSRAKNLQPTLILGSIGVSPFAEKVRWCLDVLGDPYEEEEDAGIIGSYLLGRRVPYLEVRNSWTSVSNSADILRYLYGRYASNEARSAFLKPSKKAVALEARIDQMGLDLRRFVYYHTLVNNKRSNRTALKLWGLYQKHVPFWQKCLLTLLLPLVKRYVIIGDNITAATASNGLAASKELFAEIESLLSDGRRYLLETREPTFVDFSFAALTSILLFPRDFTSGVLQNRSFPSDKDFNDTLRTEREEFKKSMAGKFTLRMYRVHRQLRRRQMSHYRRMRSMEGIK